MVKIVVFNLNLCLTVSAQQTKAETVSNMHILFEANKVLFVVSPSVVQKDE